MKSFYKNQNLNLIASMAQQIVFNNSKNGKLESTNTQDAIDEISNILDEEKTMISDAWNSSTEYTVGQYCIYNNTLWKCKVQNSGQVPSEGTYWTKVSIGSEFNTLNSNLKKYAKFKDISVDTDSEGNALIGSINAVIPLSCIPLTVGVSMSSILCNGYGIYYAKTDAYNTKITVRVTYTDYQ